MSKEDIFQYRDDAKDYLIKHQHKKKKLLIRDEEGNTLLHCHPDLARKWIKLGLDVNIPNNVGDIPLMRVARMGDIIPTELIECAMPADLNCCYEDGETVLTAYIKSEGLPAIVQMLCEQGANPNQPNAFGQYPLELSIQRNASYRQKMTIHCGDMSYGERLSDIYQRMIAHDTSYVLIGSGAYLNNIRVNGQTFLGNKITHLEMGEAKALMRLINTTEKNSDLYGVDDQGQSPLHVILTMRRNIFTRRLFRAVLPKVDVNICNNKGETALNAGIKADEFSADELIALIEAGTNVNLADKDGNTPLHNALQRDGMDSVIVSLIANGADLMYRNVHGETPISKTNSVIMQMMLSALMYCSREDVQTIVTTIYANQSEERKMPLCVMHHTDKIPNTIEQERQMGV